MAADEGDAIAATPGGDVALGGINTAHGVVARVVDGDAQAAIGHAAGAVFVRGGVVADHPVASGGGAVDEGPLAQVAGDDVALGGRGAADDVVGRVVHPDAAQVGRTGHPRGVGAEVVPFDVVA